MAQAGELVTESLDYDGGRAVTAYVPSAPVDVVVFAADGGWHITRLVDAMEKADSGWKVYDVVIDGASLVTTYRSSFNDQIQKGGIDGLVKTLAERNAGPASTPPKK